MLMIYRTSAMSAWYWCWVHGRDSAATWIRKCVMWTEIFRVGGIKGVINVGLH